jgi:pyridoxamine 5'-phosphate oxidase
MDPFVKFTEWFAEAKACKDIADATAMAVATASKKGAPSVRMVLLKENDASGFVFYTNFESRKSMELKENPQAALCLYWDAIGKQVRVEGRVEQVSDVEADAYFAGRPRESQIGAWASKQSHPLASPEELQKKIAELEKKYAGSNVPRPPFWSGWRIIPERIEFWRSKPARLHDREVFTRAGTMWEMVRLCP